MANYSALCSRGSWRNKTRRGANLLTYVRQVRSAAAGEKNEANYSAQHEANYPANYSANEANYSANFFFQPWFVEEQNDKWTDAFGKSVGLDLLQILRLADSPEDPAVKNVHEVCKVILVD